MLWLFMLLFLGGGGGGEGISISKGTVICTTHNVNLLNIMQLTDLISGVCFRFGDGVQWHHHTDPCGARG